jgi:preprotein translocase subunit SecA
MAVPVISKVGKKIFGTRNERMVKRYLRIVDQVSLLDDAMRALTDAELLGKTEEFRTRIAGGEQAEDMIPEVFAVARESMDRAVGIRNIFDPAHEFDPSRLPAEARSMYEQVQAEIDSTEARPPVEDMLGSSEPVPSWQFVDVPPALYEAVRVLEPQSRPPFRARPFDVQVIGAIVLYEGRIAEMKTGEGKTIVAPLACYLAVLAGEQVHVVTVNDYLVQRDRDWTFPFFRSLGIRVGAIHPMHMQSPRQKQDMYQCDIVYGTTSEFGFDYLRDNMKMSLQEQVQQHRNRAIVDEIDSTLIDEARTPLIISGAAHDHAPRYEMADGLARYLLEQQKPWDDIDAQVKSLLLRISGIEGDIRNLRDKSQSPVKKDQLDQAKAKLPELEAQRDGYMQYYEIELDKKKATLTHQGIAEAQKTAGIGSFYVGENIDIPHLLEQAIRAYTVYQRDRDYIVAPDEQGEQTIVIVDQNTGRKMVGRQWSDGLHQAIESKEGVPIKQETQTMATITIQNFFKLYDHLSGMTGTADTEATEFYEIYGLDVVVIPTNVPVMRVDHDDVVYLTYKDKTDAILKEIQAFHDVGRPILVGTTSVERSKELSDELSTRYGIKHEVLNAEQHERESEIIMGAGQLGAVMIATNMAGRGTDIKLGHISREAQIEHWKQRSICPKEVHADMDDAEIVRRVYRHMAPKELGLRKQDVESISDDEIRRALLHSWYVSHCWGKESKAKSMSEDALCRALDDSNSCLFHDLRFYTSAEDLGGLHVISSERHESRRVDNQFRGRSGRQGDKGSSRFFLSLEDDLMKMFAGPTTLKILSKLGMKEGDAIEHPMLSRSVGKAQRKVEERNFLIRKNILEYDEVMDHQRHDFYGMRQLVLKGQGIKERIFEHLDLAIDDACYRFIDEPFAANCMAEWVHEHLGVHIDADRLLGKDREDLHDLVRREGKEEAGRVIEITLGEFLSEEIDLGKGNIVERDEHGDDYQGLSNWAASHFKAELSPAALRSLDRAGVEDALQNAAEKLIDSSDLSGLDPFLIELYAQHELSRWVASKFGIEQSEEAYEALVDPEAAAGHIREQSRELYAERERRYPVEFALDMTTAGIQHNAQEALVRFCAWAKQRYGLDWKPDSLPSTNPLVLKDILLAEAAKWDDARIMQRVEHVIDNGGSDAKSMNIWCMQHLGAMMTPDDQEQFEEDPRGVVEQLVRNTLRMEMLQFERWILLQIVDTAWKDHLHSMDQLRESIGYRSFSQRDPRIEFKREGANLYEEMQMEIRDRVTDLIFKAKLQPQTQPRARPGEEQQGAQKSAAATQQPAAQSTRAVTAASEGGGVPGAPQSQGATTQKPRQKPPVNAALTLGRNEVVTVLDPKSGKKESMKFKKAKPLLEQGWRLVNE